jgi:dTDP-4-amino-4,6-dideoxygalactose transaminase
LRECFLPYSLPWIGEEEIAEVVDSLRSGWITTGPKTKRFEEEFAAYTGSRHAIGVSSCTAALHIALTALGVGPGDEVILPTLTFCATANVVVHLGAKPVLVDVDAHGLMPSSVVEAAVTPRTKAIIPVHYAGQACEMDSLLALADRHRLAVVEDGAHAAGSEYKGRRIGGHGKAVAFSFYATKNMTTGEGGMITTEDERLAQVMRRLSLHGMSRDAWNRYSEKGSWYYEVLEPGYKNNMTDIQASLGIHQLGRLEQFIVRRRTMAVRYSEALADLQDVLHLPEELPGRRHTYHVFPIVLKEGALRIGRDEFIDRLRAERVGASVHFIPVHRHPFYSEAYGYRPQQFPEAERLYQGMISLPLYPKMTDIDCESVWNAVHKIVADVRKPMPTIVPAQTAAGFQERGNRC